MNLWSIKHFLNILLSLLGGFAVALLLHPPKSDEKNVQEMLNWSEVRSKKYYL